ncbi:MAG: CDC27 family protein, partial [Leptospiraceae bacterium]|nr:CDC27 family protein [Leptospiraceae bacterium]
MRAAIVPTGVVLLCAALFGQMHCSAQIRNAQALQTDAAFQFMQEPPVQSELEANLEGMQVEGAVGSAAEFNDRAIVRTRLLQLNGAEQDFLRSIRLAPANPVPYLNLSRLYYLLEETDNAYRVLDRFVDRAEANERDLFQIGQDLMFARRDAEARLYMRAMLARRRLPVEAALWLAADRMRSQDYAAAMEYYDRTLAINPDESRALFGMAYIHYQAANYDRAAFFAGLAIDHGSIEPDVYYLSARSLFQLERFEQALQVLRDCPVDRRNLEMIRLQ